MTSNTSTTSSDGAASTQRLLGASLFRENLLKPFSGWLIIPLWISILVFDIAIFMDGVRKQEPPPIILSVLIFLALIICIAGFFVVGPNESRAMVLATARLPHMKQACLTWRRNMPMF